MDAVAAQSRIVGGNFVQAEDIPFACAINFPDWFCSGSLISEYWVLTAGHCTYGVPDDGANVTMGNSNREGSGTVTINSLRVIPHPNYRPNIVGNDLGLIELTTPFMQTPKIQPVRYMSAGARHEGEDVTAIGWGKTSDDSNSAAQFLHYVNVTVATHESCEDIYGTLVVGTDFCLNTTDGKGVCNGDSGGPTTNPARDTQYGVNSFVHILGCESGRPHAIANVATHRGFIQCCQVGWSEFGYDKVQIRLFAF